MRIYKDLDSPPEHYENAFHCDATWREAPPMGSVLRCVEGPEVGGDTIWVNMALAYERLPERVKAQIAGLRASHSIQATFGAAMPIEQRLALKERFPDAEHPVVRTHPETGEKVLFVNAFTTHFVNFHTAGQRPLRLRLRAGRAASCSTYLIRQAAVPGVPGALALDAEQLRDLGQPQHPALRRPGLLARPSARWSAPGSSASRPSEPPTAPDHQTPTRRRHRCTSTTTPSSPRSRTRWSSPPRRTAPSGSRPTSPRTSR